MMIKPWLIRIVGKTKQYISLQVLANWIGLLANIVVTASVARLLGALYEGSFEEGQLSATLLAALAAVVVRIVCTLAASRMSFLASDEVKRILRERIYRKLCRLGLSYTEKIGTSEAVQIAGEGVDQLEVYFGSYLPQLFYSLLAPVTLFAVFLPISVKAAVVLLICVPLIPVAIMGVQKLARRLLGQYWGVYADLGGTFLDNVQGLTTLKIYEADGERHKEMNRQAEAFRRITMKVLYMQLNSITVMDVIAYGGAAAGIILSVLEFQAGHISLAGAIMIVLLSADFFIPLRQLGSFFHVAMNGMAASDKMKALFELPEEEERPASFPEQEAEITLSHVDFSYDGSREILKDVSLTIPPKGFVCLVGESGCGKSTIASLLTGVNRGYRGHITAGDTELSDIREESLMSHVTLVNHNAYLFRGTVRDNLRMAAPEADDAALIRALKAANIYEFLEGEKGLDTELAEQGGNLSGGQRQRIALARALLHDTPVYIFDEATSNIDVESEKAIMDTVRALAGRRTILLISHRLANVEAADRIFCMDRGRIAEEGAHAELLEKNGLYASMYRKQKELILIVVCGVLRGILHYGEQLCNHYIAFHLLALIRDKIFGALRRLSPAKLETKEKGNLISIITSDIELLEVFYAHTISPILIAVITSALMLAFFYWLHPLMCLTAACGYLLVGLFMPWLISRLGRNAGSAYRNEFGDFDSFFLDSLRGLRETLQFGREEARLSEIGSRTESLSRKQKKMKQYTGLGTALTGCIVSGFSLLMLFLGIRLYGQGAAGFREVLIGTVAMMSSFGPVIALSGLASNLLHTFASGNLVLDILEETPVVEDVTDGLDTEFSGAAAEHVRFAYDAETVLADVDADFPENRIIGINGQSGCGKSTLLKLLMRFWDVDSGRIALSGKDVRSLNTRCLRRLESFVTQDTQLFHGTVADNLRIAKADATQEELEQAAREASLHEFILSLEKGYDTDVGELGDRLSGGERQRIGIARAFLHGAPFLLLDEPTSNLDSLNEGIILRSLAEKRENRTIVLVSHRKSTMGIADIVCEMEDGRLRVRKPEAEMDSL